MGISPSFEAKYRVRFDEAGADGLLRTSGLLRYAQDLAWRHSDAAGFDRAWYAARQQHWLVRYVRIEPCAEIGYGETLRVTTRVAGWRRVLARRHTEFESQDGEGARLVAHVETDWVLLTTAGRPATIPAEITSAFAAGRSIPPQRVRLPPSPSEALEIERPVRFSDVDPMSHVNHAAYVDLIHEALEALAPELSPAAGSTHDLEYLRPALPGMTLRVQLWRAGDAEVACRVLDGHGAELLRAMVQRPQLSRPALTAPRSDRTR